MSEEKSSQPIIVKKINKHGGHHGGAWKVAYADFVTAMMALFIVLWILGQDQKIRNSVAHYFKNPIGFSNKGKNILVGDNSGLSGANDAQKNSKLISRLQEMKILREMGEKLLGELKKNETFKSLAGQIKIDFVKEGLRIEILESSKDFFFEIGTAKLKKSARLLLAQIGNNLAKLPNKIILQGHTDSRPYSGGGKGYTNFELSADRANSARRALIADSLSEKQIFEVNGFADSKLRDPKHPYSFINRRISIIVKYTDEGK